MTVNDAARPSVTQIVNNAVDLCRQQTNGSEYDMALWLHDWTLDQLEHDHNLNWCSAESGLTRHQGTCESYQRIYSKLLDAAGIANGASQQRPHLERRKDRRQMVPDGPDLGRHQRQLVRRPGPAPSVLGLTDELMAIAHSDHTANYQRTATPTARPTCPTITLYEMARQMNGSRSMPTAFSST